MRDVRLTRRQAIVAAGGMIGAGIVGFEFARLRTETRDSTASDSQVSNASEPFPSDDGVPERVNGEANDETDVGDDVEADDSEEDPAFSADVPVDGYAT